MNIRYLNYIKFKKRGTQGSKNPFMIDFSFLNLFFFFVFNKSMYTNGTFYAHKIPTNKFNN